MAGSDRQEALKVLPQGHFLRAQRDNQTEKAWTPPRYPEGQVRMASPIASAALPVVARRSFSRDSDSVFRQSSCPNVSRAFFSPLPL